MDVQLYGNGHPYSLPRRGSLTTLPKLKLADVKGWYTKWWHAGNASFVVTGAVDPAAFTRELDARFGKWKVGKDKPPVVAAALAVPSTKLVFVESPGSVQSFILTGAAGLQKTDAGWYAADMAGTLAAGNFSSPLNMVLREEKGWSYGAYGGFDATKDLGWFQSYASVQADKTAPAVAEFVGVYSRAMANPPSAELLQVTKDGMVKSLPGGFETNARAAGSLSRLVADGLPTDTWQTWGAKVNAVTAEEAHAAAKKWLDPAHQIIVVVGPRTVTGKDANGTELNVDVFSELKGLGYAFVDATPAKAGGSSKGDKKKGE
jgi:predicted Zn-dependent peptidase